MATHNLYEGSNGFYKDSSGNIQTTPTNPLLVRGGDVIDFSRLSSGGNARGSWANFGVFNNDQSPLFTTAQLPDGYGSGHHTVSSNASGLYTLFAHSGTVLGELASDVMTGNIRVGSGGYDE